MRTRGEFEVISGSAVRNLIKSLALRYWHCVNVVRLNLDLEDVFEGVIESELRAY